MEKSFTNSSSILNSIKSAIASHKIFTDKTGKPVDFEFIEMNSSFENLTGLKSKDVIGKRFSELFPDVKNNKNDLIEFYSEVALKGKSEFIEFYSNSRKKWFQVYSHCPKKRNFIVEFQDITESKRAEIEFKERETFFREALKITTHDIFVIDVTEDGDFKIEYANREEELLKGFNLSGSVRGRLFSEIFPPEISKKVYANYNRCIEAGVPILFEESVNMEEGIRWWFTTLIPLKDKTGRIYRIIGSSLEITERKNIEEELIKYREQLEEMVKERTVKLEQEITERKSAEAELFKSRENLRALSLNIEKIRENEKAKLSRDIHDEIGQTLTAVKFDLVKLENEIPDKISTIKEIIGLTNSVIISIKRIATELRPGVLDQFGIVETLKWYSSDFSKHFNIECKYNVNPESLTLSSEQSIQVFRIFQELTTNVLKYSKATLIEWNLYLEKGKVFLKFHDNGIGIDTTRKNNVISLGILGMSERAISLNGNFEISGDAKGGTNALLTFPLN